MFSKHLLCLPVNPEDHLVSPNLYSFFRCCWLLFGFLYFYAGHVYKKPVYFSQVNMFYVNLIIRQAKEYRKEKKNFSAPTYYCFSVTKSYPALCDPVNCSRPGFIILHHHLEFAQIHIHRVSDAIQPSHPLSSLLLLPSTFPSIKLFSYEVALPKVLEFQLQHQSFQ